MPVHDPETFELITGIILKYNSTGPIIALLADIHLQAAQIAHEDGNHYLAEVSLQVAGKLQELGPLVALVDASIKESEETEEDDNES